jgi:uncharacterized protein (DUF2141 family)
MIFPSESVIGFWQNKNSDGIELVISNIKNREGLIRIGVFDSETGYPDNPSFSFSLAKDTLSSGKLRLFIPLKNPGNYEISVLDDENKNGKMDYIFGIKPKEGFGFSNNPKVTSRKAPPFEQTRFKYPGGKIKIGIGMVYI